MKVQLITATILLLSITACQSTELETGKADFYNKYAMHASQKASTGRSGGVSFVTFTDPDEGAFTVEVPKGWKVEGRLNRKSSMTYSPYVRAVSPDGQTHLFFGDPNLPVYCLLDQASAWMGYKEGSPVPGNNETMVYRSYVSGQQYAAEYAQATGRNWGGYKQQNVAAENKLTTEMRQNHAKNGAAYGMNSKVTGGEVRFACGKNLEYQGLVIAVTTLVESYGTGMWQVDRLGGYIALGQQAQETEGIFRHVLYSFKINPRWEARENQIAQQNLAISRQNHINFQSNAYSNISKTLSETNDIIVNGWNQRQSNMDRTMQNYSNAFRGTEDVTNPYTDEKYNIWDQYNYYWQGQDGTIIGTNLNQNPHPGSFTPMKRGN